MIWSKHSEEQKQIDTTAIAGRLPTTASTRPEVGVYVNDSGADKLSYYLDYRVDVKPVACGTDGTQFLDVRVTLKSRVPVGAPLTESVLGPGISGEPPGAMLHSFYIYAPVGGRIDKATLEGSEAPMATFTYRGRQVGAVTIDLQRGQKRAIDFVLVTGPHQTGEPHLVTTPGATGTGQGTVGKPAC